MTRIKRHLKCAGLFLVVLIGMMAVFAGCSSKNVNALNGAADGKAEGIVLTKLKTSYKKTTPMEVKYSEESQKNIYNQIKSLKDKGNYKLDNMLAIFNPYYSNTTGLYIYFATDESLKASYTVKVEGLNDFSQDLNSGTKSGYAKKHEYMIIGLVPGVENQVKLDLKDKSGKIVGEKLFKCTPPDLRNGKVSEKLKLTRGESTAKLSRGLYTILGRDTLKAHSDAVLIYDDFGVIRSEIPIDDYRATRLLFSKSNLMYMSISNRTMISLDRLGRVHKLYKLKDYKLHHDYIFDKDENLLVLATKIKSDSVQDRIIKIDVKTGNVSEIVDLGKIFPKYKSTTVVNSKKELDWMHINTIDLVGKDSLILSSRETSTIIKLNNVFKKPVIDYLIGSKEFWKDSGYDKYCLSQVGKFPLQSGQHTTTSVFDKSLPKGQYYIHLFNNNNTVSHTRPNFKWTFLKSYEGSGVGNKGEFSNYYKYLIDSGKKTFKLVERIDVAYSGYVSSSQELDGNYILDSGQAFTIYEFDKDKKLIQKLEGSGDKYFYRVYKYDYKNYWFK